MPGRPLTLREVGGLFGLSLPSPPGKAKCPFKKHTKRAANDKTFRVYRSRTTGQELWKCHRAGQGILMWDGSVKLVEHIEAGDLVMGPDSQPRTVVETGTGEGEMFEVRPSRTLGSSWFVNEHHILSLAESGRRGILVDVSVREWLAWPVKRKSHFMLQRAEPVTFGGPAPKLPIDPYFLGVLLGDGMMKEEYTPGVRSADPEIVAALYEQAAKLGLNVRVERHPTCPMYYLPGVSLGGAGGTQQNVLAGLLRNLGLLGTGAATKFIPEAYKRASMADRAALLAGLIDTDGAKQGTLYVLSSKSKRLMGDAAFIARSLGMGSFVRSHEHGSQNGFRGTYFHASIKGRRAHTIPCRVERKRLNVRQDTKNALRAGFTVIPTGSVERYYGFNLDGDRRYLLDDFTISHNCWSCSDGDSKTGVGDAIGFYATMAGVDRKEAWRRLRDDGFDVPGDTGERRGGGGSSRAAADRRAYEATQKKVQNENPPISVEGVRPPKVIPLEQTLWKKWSQVNTGALARFAEQRGLTEAFLREHGVVEVDHVLRGDRVVRLPQPCIGFTYFDPGTGLPCRVKVRGIDKKMYWVEPKSPEGSDARALSPLYLETELRPSLGGPLIVTEGEIDALSLRFIGFEQVVSLPDGSESAKTADLSTVYMNFTPWMICTDADKPGDISARQFLTQRAYAGTDIFRVEWKRLMPMGDGTEDLVRYKDANDALRAGFTREEFVTCLDMAVGRCDFGKPEWRFTPGEATGSP